MREETDPTGKRKMSAGDWAIAALFAATIVVVAAQVIWRYAFNDSLMWTEELSRFCLLFCAALGGGLALRSGELVGVDLVTMVLPRAGRRAAEVLVCLAMIAFSVLLLAPAWDFVDIGSLQTSPALGWNMFWVHMAVLLAPITLALGALERLIRVLAGLRPEVREEPGFLVT